MENKNLFLNQVCEKLYGKIDSKIISIVKQSVENVLNGWEIKVASKSIIEYNYEIPKETRTYLIEKSLNGNSDGTIKQYHLVLYRFFSDVKMSIQQIEQDTVRRWMFYYKNTYKITNRTLNSKRIILNDFFNWCVSNGIITRNPMENIERIKYSKEQRIPLNSIELEKVILNCENDKEKAIVLFLVSSGCRVSETCNIKLSDINPVTKEISVIGKGNKRRTVLFSARAEVAINQYLSNRKNNSKYLFCSDTKNHDKLSKATIESIIKKIGKRAKIDRSVFPHLLRHTMATNLVNNGMPIQEVQVLLGHNSVETTSIYSHINIQSIKNNFNKYTS